MFGDVVRDFAAAAPDRESAAWIGAVTWSVSDGGNAYRVLVTAADGTAFGFAARRDTPALALCDVADRFQDFVADNLRVGLPPVPGTAVAAVVDGAACWTDAESGWRCPIGAYP
ncbi:hypothetical protein AB0J40_40795 [Amycolatopsis sp. NPDC049691]|uniref:hypothetical protein n=1 Tax=Amycolatopsis sp. NPDC049691 TaxID=3155155 RepID=UPI0034375C21